MPFLKAMRLIDALGCVGSAIILLLASAWIPLVGPFLSLLTPLPFLYYATKTGLKAGLKVAVITGIVVGLLANMAGYPHMITLYVELSLMGMILAAIYKRPISFGLAVFWGTVSMLLIGIIIIVMIGLTKNLGPPTLILDYFQRNLRETLQLYQNMGPDQEGALQLQEYVKVMVEIIARIYPALLIVGTGFIVWLNMVISRPLFRMTHLEYPDFGPTDRWLAPERMVWGLIAAGFSLFLPLPGLKFLAINAIIVLSVIYVFHGLSIVLFFFNKYHVPSWLRIGAYLLIIFQQIVMVGLAMAGLFDQWVDFRKIHSKKVTE